MRRIFVLVIILFCTCIMCTNIEAKTKRIGNFEFKYSNYKKNVWVHRITPLSDKGIKKLKIPGKLGGKKVIKLSGIDDSYNYGSDIFGLHTIEEMKGVFPENVYNRVKKIRSIVLPQYLKKISGNCFMYLYNKDIVSINIPRCADEKSVSNLWQDWKKITISTKNRYYMIKNGCLISKKDMCVSGFVCGKKQIKIPEGVKQIGMFSNVVGVKRISIPASVKKIYNFGIGSDEKIKFYISKNNKHYRVKNNNIISKVSKRLVVGYVSNGELKVPKGTKSIGTNGLVGSIISKLIIPSSVKSIVEFFGGRLCDNVVCICKRKKPPKLLDSTVSNITSMKVYVPKGTIKKYKNKWDGLKDGVGNLSFIERMR